MNIALYFGSFNPIHNGHIAIAEYLLSAGFADELWMVISPNNPLKKSSDLASECGRKSMVEIAVSQSVLSDRIRVEDFEFSMPKPSYTINSLRWLTEQYPQHSFSLVIGMDNLSIFDKWRDWECIISDYDILVYPRNGYDGGKFLDYNRVQIMIEAPQYDICSTTIRCDIAQGKIVASVSKGVMEYIKKTGLYE